jgi:hypothetical protein
VKLDLIRGGFASSNLAMACKTALKRSLTALLPIYCRIAQPLLGKSEIAGVFCASMLQDPFGRSEVVCQQAAWRKEYSMKLSVGGVLVFASLVALSGCAVMHAEGPCYGSGCPVLTGASDATSKSAAVSQPPSAQPSAANAASSKSFASKIKGKLTHRSKSEAAKQAPANQQPNPGN